MDMKEAKERWREHHLISHLNHHFPCVFILNQFGLLFCNLQQSCVKLILFHSWLRLHPRIPSECVIENDHVTQQNLKKMPLTLNLMPLGTKVCCARISNMPLPCLRTPYPNLSPMLPINSMALYVKWTLYCNKSIEDMVGIGVF